MFEVIPAICYCKSIHHQLHSPIASFFRDGSLALMTRAIHDEKLAQAIDSSLAHFMW